MSDASNSVPPNRPFQYQDALAYLFGRIDYERATGDRNNHDFRLERTEVLFEMLGLGGYLAKNVTLGDTSNCSVPQTVVPPKVPLVHIAGTKGKGSTATMVSEILTAAGHRVGLYTSPHLTELEERFRINGVACSREELVELVELVAPAVDKLDAAQNGVSFFELTTAMAVLHFDRQECDAIVMEVGLGGRLDSTNVCASSVAAITSIGLDHQRVLGNTLAEIAGEKAGIIKSGVPVVSGVTQPEAVAQIRLAAEKSGSILLERDHSFVARNSRDAAIGSEFEFAVSDDRLVNRSDKAESPQNELPLYQSPLYLALDGAHQVQNAAVAIAVSRVLSSELVSQPLAISDQQIRDGLRTVRCSGRLERFAIGDAPSTQVILDTAHNLDSVRALCDAVSCRIADPTTGTSSPRHAPPTTVGELRRPVVAVFGTSRDKDVVQMTNILATVADEVVCTRYTTNPRAVSVEHLVQAFSTAPAQKRVLKIHRQEDPGQALQDAIRIASPDGGTVVICGSFFLAGELRPQVIAFEDVRPVGQRAVHKDCDDGDSSHSLNSNDLVASYPDDEST